MKRLNEPPPPSPRRAWIFTAWTFAIGWGGAIVLRLVAGPMGGPLDADATNASDWAATVLRLLFFLLPAIITFVMARRQHIPLRRWGVRLAPLSTLLAAPLVGLALALLATALPIAFGVSEFDPSGMGEVQRLVEARRVEALELQLALADAPRPLGQEIAGGLVTGFVLGLILAAIIELPWRGLVLTELTGPGFARQALLTAILAGLWWLPFQFLVGMPGLYSASAAAISVLSYALLGVPLAWVRCRTRSILPAGILAVTVLALNELPRIATAGGSHLQLELCSLAAMGLLAAGALLWPPKGRGGASDKERA